MKHKNIVEQFAPKQTTTYEEHGFWSNAHRILYDFDVSVSYEKPLTRNTLNLLKEKNESKYFEYLRNELLFELESNMYSQTFSLLTDEEKQKLSIVMPVIDTVTYISEASFGCASTLAFSNKWSFTNQEQLDQNQINIIRRLKNEL